MRPLVRRIVALGGGAAVLQPQRHGARVVVRRDRHLLVVAAQADHRAGRRLLLAAQQQLDHATAVRAAVDVVAEKDEARWPPGGTGLAGGEQAAQLVEAAVDIADREGDGWHERTKSGGDGARLQARASKSRSYYSRRPSTPHAAPSA